VAVFIEVTTDAFQDTFTKKTVDAQLSRRAGASRVRRPLRGLEIKEDTYAILKVIQADGTELPLIDSGSQNGTSAQYANFILQSVQEARMEKHQIVETFGEAYIYFFGESPRFLDVAAILIDSNDFNWEAEWWANYNAYLRGTKSVELGARTYLFYNDTIVEGYMLNAMALNTADNPMQVTLTFRLFLTNYQNVSFVGDTDFPIRGSITVPSDLGFNPLTDSINPDQMSQFLANALSETPDDVIDQGFAVNRALPLRSQIIDNVDEWTGSPPEGGPDLFDALRQQAEQDIEEAQDALQAIIQNVSSYGVDVNSPAFMMAMGFGPSFSQTQGFGIGAGAGASTGASFSASASIDVSASVDFGSSSPDQDLEQQELDEVEQQQLLEAQAQIALQQNGGAISFSAFDQPDFSVSASAGVSTSAGAFAGVSTSSGSGLGFGDPSHFVLTAGASFSGGAGVGASIAVGGAVTAFAMASFDGDFDPAGTANDPESAAQGFDS